MIQPDFINQHFTLTSDVISALLGYPESGVVKIERSALRAGCWDIEISQKNPDK
jgi:hypothetical protein